jgi:hypothetical protein
LNISKPLQSLKETGARSIRFNRDNDCRAKRPLRCCVLLIEHLKDAGERVRRPNAIKRRQAESFGNAPIIR